MTEIEKAVTLQECVFHPVAHVIGLHFEPGDDTNVRIILSNDMVITAKLSDLEITRLQ